jgi:hypothetical protein
VAAQPDKFQRVFESLQLTLTETASQSVDAFAAAIKEFKASP